MTPPPIHESNNHWSSAQRTHRRHQQVTQSTKRRNQLSTRHTYLLRLTQHTSLARHRGNALIHVENEINHLGCTDNSVIGHAPLQNLHLPKFSHSPNTQILTVNHTFCYLVLPHGWVYNSSEVTCGSGGGTLAIVYLDVVAFLFPPLRGVVERCCGLSKYVACLEEA